MDKPPDFAAGSAAFLKWFRAQPGTTFHPSLKITDLRNRDAGRGIVATEDIPPETDLFTIPRSTILSVETSELAQKLPDLFSNVEGVDQSDTNEDEDPAPSELPNSWLNLIFIILYESLHHKTSRWAPYLSVLPSSQLQFNTLMFWKQEELSELQASEITSKIGKDSADTMFKERIIPVVNKHAEVFYPTAAIHLTDEELLEKCHLIGSLIMSYAFDLQPDEDDEDEEENEDGWVEDRAKPSTMGMVPMADMLNADAEFNAHLSHGDDALIMTSLREIKAGEEVLNYYGPLPNGELLRRYGYTSQKHARYDVVEFGWTFVKETLLSTTFWQGEDAAKLQRLVMKLEHDEGIDKNDGFVLEREAGDPNEQGLCTTEAKFAKFPDELVTLISRLVSQMLKDEVRKRKLADDAKDKLIKSKILGLLENLVSKRLTQYKTTLEEDEALFQNARGRKKMAVEVRFGEKKLLGDALGWVKEVQEKYNEEPRQKIGSGSSQKHMKRQKQ